MKRREENLSNNLLSVLVDDQIPNIVFAWRRVKKLLGATPSSSRFPEGNPGKFTAAHTREEVVLSGVGITPAISGPILERQRVDIFRLNHFISRAISRRPGPCQGRRSVAEPSAAVLDRVAGGSIIALGEL